MPETMTATEVAFAIRGLMWLSGGLATILSGVIVMAARVIASRIAANEKAIVDRLGKLETSVQSEFRKFDRRLTRVETLMRLNPHQEDLPDGETRA